MLAYLYLKAPNRKNQSVCSVDLGRSDNVIDTVVHLYR